MLPYFVAPKLTHYALLAIAVLLGHGLQRYRARQIGLDHGQAGMLSFVLVLGAAFGAHWLALASQGQLFSSHPAILLFPYAGGVALGGLGGGFLAAIAYAHRNRLPLIPHLNAAAWAFPFPWAVLRTGCFLAHDSVGRFYDGPLALDAPGGPRHDLAFYEILWAISLGITYAKWPTEPAAKLLVSYGLLRAVLAPLRIQPAALDWVGAAVLVVAGIVILFRFPSQRVR